MLYYLLVSGVFICVDAVISSGAVIYGVIHGVLRWSLLGRSHAQTQVVSSILQLLIRKHVVRFS